MRAAPESFVQTVVAERIFAKGAKVLLEASAKQIHQLSEGSAPESSEAEGRGRIDVVVYFKSDEPRFLIEIKKLPSKGTLQSDCDRIRRLIEVNPKIQNGFLVAYTMAAKKHIALSRIDEEAKRMNVKIVRRLKPCEVTSKKGAQRVLAGAVLRVDRSAA